MRKIIHIDCDCFYAALEMRDNPSLASRPIAIGGRPEQRGVVATCNYPARRFGVRSAMAMAHALRLCPELEIIRPRFPLYRQVSNEIHRIFADYTELIEPLSLDEAFLDVSDSTCCQGSATLIAEEIRARVKEQLAITVSAGVAPCKFLAKIASDWNKPDGLFVITPVQVDGFVQKLPVSKISGVGKVTAAKMQRIGVITCGDLQRFSRLDLCRYFGSYGDRLYDMARGIDDRPVQPKRQRKSLSVEHTYNEDLPDFAAVISALPALLDEMALRYQKISHEYRVIKRFVKVKFADFTQTTLEQVMSHPEQPWLEPEVYARLLEQAWQRGQRPVRLLGVGVRLKEKSRDSEQMMLFDDKG